MVIFQIQNKKKCFQDRFIGHVICYNLKQKRVDCKSEGNIFGVKKWL